MRLRVRKTWYFHIKGVLFTFVEGEVLFLVFDCALSLNYNRSMVQSSFIEIKHRTNNENAELNSKIQNCIQIVV